MGIIRAVIGEQPANGNRYFGGETDTTITKVDQSEKIIYVDVKDTYTDTLQPKIIHLNLVDNPTHILTDDQIEILTNNDANNIKFNDAIYYLVASKDNQLVYSNFDEEHLYKFLKININEKNYIYTQYELVDDIDFQAEIVRAKAVEKAIYDLIGDFTDRDDNTVCGYFNDKAIGDLAFTHNTETGILHFDWFDILGRLNGQYDLQLNTDEIIIAADLDYENKKIIFTLSGTESGEHKTIECDLSSMIDDYNERLATLQDNLDTETTRAIVAETVLQQEVEDETARAIASENAITQNINNHKNDKNNPHKVTTEQIQAVSYGKTQGLSEDQKTQAKINISLQNVANRRQSADYKNIGTGDVRNNYFTTGGAFDLYTELSTNETNIQDEIDQIGTVVGYQKQIIVESGESGEDIYYYGNTYELDPNGFIQQTKDLADQNKSRLDNIATGLTVNKTTSDTGILHNLTVAGDLVVKGTTTTSDQQTIQSESTIIVTNSTNAPLTRYSGTVALKGNFETHEVTAQTYQPNYFWYINDSLDDPTKRIIVVGGHQYVLDDSPTYTQGRQYYSQTAEAIGLYDVNEDAVVIGEGNYYGGNFEFDTKYSVIELTVHTYIPNKYYILVDNQYVLATGDFDPNETYYLGILQGQHLATRADSNSLINGHLLAWDATSYTLVDSGKSIGILENEHQQEVTARQSADQRIWNEIGTIGDDVELDTIYGRLNRETLIRSNHDRKIREDLGNDLQNTAQTLQNNIDDETTRAIVEETILQEQIDELKGDTQSSLADEIARATAAEAALDLKIDNLEDKTDLEVLELTDAIDTETTRAIVAETVLQQEVEDETTRAIVAEKILEDGIDNANSDIDDLNDNLSTYKRENDLRVGQTEDDISELQSTTATKVDAVGKVEYKTVNNVKTFTRSNLANPATETTIVNINTIKQDMQLNNVTNDRQVVGIEPAYESGEPINYDDHIILFSQDGYHIKDSGWTLADTGKIDTISINGTNIPADNHKNVDLPAYPTQFQITANATDGLFNITGTSGANAVTYEFAPYSAKQQNASFYSSDVNPTLTARLNYDGYLYATKLYSKGSEVVTNSDIETISNNQIDSLFNNQE